MRAMSELGRGAGAAAWFNAHAKRVTAKRVEAFRATLPDARVFAADSLEQAAAHADALIADPPAILFCGGGDGTAVTLLNLLRERGAKTFPTLALFKLGTGNGWPRAVHTPAYEKLLPRLPRLSLTPPSHRFDLLEVEGRLCQFAGVGWDATILHDYKRNLERRQSQLVGSRAAARLSKGVGGYLYSLFRITVPEELVRLREGRSRVRLTNIGEPAMTYDERGRRVTLAASEVELYEGPASVAAASIEPYWGAGFKAFPHSLDIPGRFNFRVYDRNVVHGVKNMVRLWRGDDVPGLTDWFLTGVRLTMSRPMPFQVGGDVVGTRETLELLLAKEKVDLVNWAELR